MAMQVLESLTPASRTRLISVLATPGGNDSLQRGTHGRQQRSAAVEMIQEKFDCRCDALRLLSEAGNVPLQGKGSSRPSGDDRGCIASNPQRLRRNQGIVRPM